MTSQASISWGRFVWDAEKEQTNRIRHGVDYRTAVQVFLDPGRVILDDVKHSDMGLRRFCIGKTQRGILTVRFTHRGDQIELSEQGIGENGERFMKTRTQFNEDKPSDQARIIKDYLPPPEELLPPGSMLKHIPVPQVRSEEGGNPGTQRHDPGNRRRGRRAGHPPRSPRRTGCRTDPGHPRVT